MIVAMADFGYKSAIFHALAGVLERRRVGDRRRIPQDGRLH